MKCVVTGGNGFIGRHVVAELARRRFDVVVYDANDGAASRQANKVKYVCGDIRNVARLRETLAEADFVFHLAGLLGTHELFERPQDAVDVNVNGALNVLQSCLESKKDPRILFPTKPLEWNNIYSITSQARERLGYAYRENMALDVRIFLLRNLYGPGQKLFPVRKAIPLFMLQALDNRPVEVFGDGTQLVELSYVEDVAKCIVDYVVYDGDVSHTHELPTDAPMSVNRLAEEIIARTGSTSPITHLPMRLGEPDPVLLARARDVQKLLGKIERTSFDAGMRRTLDWYRTLPPAILAHARRYYFDSLGPSPSGMNRIVAEPGECR